LRTGSTQVLLLLLPVALLLFLLVRWHARSFQYRCPQCGNVFQLSTMGDAISPNLLDVKLVRCPSCGTRSQLPPLPKEPEHSS
jgi:hypothetical protein